MLEDIFMLLAWTVLVCFTLVVGGTILEVVLWVEDRVEKRRRK